MPSHLFTHTIFLGDCKQSGGKILMQLSNRHCIFNTAKHNSYFSLLFSILVNGTTIYPTVQKNKILAFLNNYQVLTLFLIFCISTANALTRVTIVTYIGYCKNDLNRCNTSLPFIKVTWYLNEVFLKISTLGVVGKPTYFHIISVNLYGNFIPIVASISSFVYLTDTKTHLEFSFFSSHSCFLL